MEPDPLPWLMFALSLLLVGVATALEVVFTVTSRSEVRRRSEQGDPAARLLDTYPLNHRAHLYLTLSLFKNGCLLFLGATSAWVTLHSQSTQIFLTFLGIWLLMALVQPLWRSWTVRNVDTLVFQLAPLVRILDLLLRPFVFLVQQVAVWANPYDPARSDETNGLTDETLRLLMNTADSGEAIEENEREMIVSILEMNDTVAREVMVPRIDMVAIDIETSFQEALDIIIAAGHSRIPVYEDHIDRILGILYAKDLLRCFRDQTTDVPIRQLLRPPYFIPASKKVDALFQEMQKHRVHIATVVDEYGGTAGLVTIEDIIEEIVGDIQDEYDIEEDIYVQGSGPDTYLLNSRLDVYSLSKLLDINLDTDTADTLGGFLYSLMEHVPEQGEYVEHQGWRFTVLSLEGRRIEQVRAERVPTPSQEEPDTAGKSVHERRSSAASLINIQAME
ncbi:MAG: HlyC/CorC family transporter [Caldilineaceae bacterium]|nr:HlyC/CorC family transporter [Caldilineaceae bacterium]